MKLKGENLQTSTEVMKELFGMNPKMIHRLPEKRRYEKIYEYLVEEKQAEKVGTKKGRKNNYTVLEYQDGVYLIPEDIFDELDKDWVEDLDTPDDEYGENENYSRVVSLKAY